MFDSWIYFIFGFLLVAGLVVFGLVRLVMHFVRGRKKFSGGGSHLQIAFSREDGLSQMFLLLSLAFLGVTFFSINRNLGAPLSWQTIVFALAVLSLAAAYRFKSIYVLCAGLITSLIWWLAESVFWTAGKNAANAVSVTIAFLIFLIMFSVGSLHNINPKWKRSALVYKLLGSVGVIGLLFIFSTQGGLRLFQSALEGGPFYASWQLSVSLLVLAAGLAVSVYEAVAKKTMSWNLAAAVSLLGIFFLLIPFFPNKPLWDISGGYYYAGGAGGLSGYGVVWITIFNLLTLLALLGLILSGYRQKEPWQVNFGAVFLFFFILVKYFDWFFTFMDKSAFFIGAGVLLFVVGYFMEKSRRKIVQQLNAGGV